MIKHCFHIFSKNLHYAIPLNTMTNANHPVSTFLNLYILGVLSSSSSAGCISPKKCLNSDSERSLAIPDTRIVDGKLHFEKKWYTNY